MLITDCGHPRITKISRNKKKSRIQDISEIAKNSKIAKSDLSQNYKYLNYWNTQIIRKMQMSPKLENSKFFLNLLYGAVHETIAYHSTLIILVLGW